jgi:prepilin-type N-terminal cleavage/methylation domain-containing protein
MRKTKKQNGFTLIESIIVLSIVGILAGASMIGFRSSHNSANLKEAQASILNALEIARNRAVTGVGNGNHIVDIEGNIISSLVSFLHSVQDLLLIEGLECLSRHLRSWKERGGSTIWYLLP